MPRVMPLAMLLVLLSAPGCDRPSDSQSDAAAQPGQPPVPFHDRKATTSPPQNSPATADAGSNPTSNLAANQIPNQIPNQAPNQAPNSETGIPFHDPANLPAGTLLTVRLKNSISAENPGANGIFEAVVDDPVVIEGNRLVPRGATVVGRVESARASRVISGWLWIPSISLASVCRFKLPAFSCGGAPAMFRFRQDRARKEKLHEVKFQSLRLAGPRLRRAKRRRARLLR